MKSRTANWLPVLLTLSLTTVIWAGVTLAADQDRDFSVSSSTFSAGATLPLSTIYADSSCYASTAAPGD